MLLPLSKLQRCLFCLRKGLKKEKRESTKGRREETREVIKGKGKKMKREGREGEGVRERKTDVIYQVLSVLRKYFDIVEMN